MFRRGLLPLLLLVLIPTFSHAWYVNAKTSPTTGQGTISPTGTKYYAAGVDSGEYTVTPAAGRKISHVTLDGVQIQPNANGKYVAPYAANKTYRYIVAYFTANTVNITTSVTAGSGAIREDNSESLTNIPVGSARQLLILPNPGYAIDTVIAEGAVITDNVDGSKTATYTNLQANQAVSAAFSLVPVVTVSAGPDINTTTPGTATLHGSANSNQGAIAYAWEGAGLTFGSQNEAVTTVSADVAGAYVATLTVTSGGIEVSDTTAVVVVNYADSQVAFCAGCHDGKDETILSAYSGSAHKTNLVSCQGCHTNHPHDGFLPTEVTCTGCHNPLPHGEGLADCLNCHDAHSVAGGGCTSCHEFPPSSGAHAAHFGLADTSVSYTDIKTLEARYPTASADSAPSVYAFGCANCHSVDSANHRNGSIDVILYEAAAESGSLKARNAANAAYDPYTGTCSGVYCHSSGQAAPTYKTTPEWTSTDTLACDNCHSNPPDYTTGGAGTATANSHINLALDGFATGHFSGIRGPWHTPQHGDPWGYGQDSAPITCQTCHYETTDPANVGPNGFYWLDTSGNYQVPGILYPSEEDGYVCSKCHNPDDPNGPAVGIGKVLPLRHVNGKRDVIFDPRETLPQDIAWLPADPNKPARPVWFTQASQTTGWPTTGAPITWNGTTRSWSLSSATYDPATKTCSATSCHVQFETTTVAPTRPNPVWGSPVGANGGWDSCCNCHTAYCM